MSTNEIRAGHQEFQDVNLHEIHKIDASLFEEDILDIRKLDTGTSSWIPSKQKPSFQHIRVGEGFSFNAKITMPVKRILTDGNDVFFIETSSSIYRLNATLKPKAELPRTSWYGRLRKLLGSEE